MEKGRVRTGSSPAPTPVHRTPEHNAERAGGAGSAPQSEAGTGQSQGTRHPGARHVQPHCRLGSAKPKQSLNKNVTEEIIAISNDNTQFSRRRLADLGVRPLCQAARLPQAAPNG